MYYNTFNDDFIKGARMTINERKKLQKIYGIKLGILSIIAGLLLIIQTQRIYHRELLPSEQIYTVEIVTQYLSQIASVLILWVVAVIAFCVFCQFCPSDDKKLVGTFSQRKKLNRLKAKIPEDKKSASLIKAEKVNTVIIAICILYGMVALVFVCICFLDKSNYITDSNEFNPTRDMLNMLPQFLPWLGVFFLLASAVSIYLDYSAKKEMKEVMRLIVLCTKDNTLIKQGKYEKKLPNFVQKLKDKLSFLQNEKVKKYTLLGARIALPVIGVTLFIIGIFNGGLSDVLKKAIVICTECIGLG